MPSAHGGRQILPLRAREIGGQVVRDVRCAGHGRNAQEARAGALDLVPGVCTERGCCVGLAKGRNRPKAAYQTDESRCELTLATAQYRRRC